MNLTRKVEQIENEGFLLKHIFLSVRGEEKRRARVFGFEYTERQIKQDNYYIHFVGI